MSPSELCELSIPELLEELLAAFKVTVPTVSSTLLGIPIKGIHPVAVTSVPGS